MEVWGQRLGDRGVVITFAGLKGPAKGKAAHAMCTLDDLHDRHETPAWLGRWTGAAVPPSPLAKYYLTVGPGQPKLIAGAGSKPWPSPKPGNETYMLKIASRGDDTFLALLR